jgi:hypothetical protein
MIFSYKGSRFIRKEQLHTKVNILQLAVGYLNATINRKSETQNWGLELTGLVRPGKSHRLTDTGPGLARQDLVDRVFGQFWNRTESFLPSKSGPLVGYPDPLLILIGDAPLTCT